MTYENLGQPALDYFPCRYGNSKLLFRGPRRRLRGDYVTFLGGTETYGKFVELPFPNLLECDTGIRSVNLGCVNAGIDAYVSDKSLIDICARARTTVIQIMGAQNMSNRFYAVHQRRNDRFLHASKLLKTIFAGVDFADFSFTRHLLAGLQQAAPEKFAMVETELKDAWVARMQTLIEQIGGQVVLLWLADHAPDDCDGLATAEPLFVDRAMVERIEGSVAEVVEIVADPQERRDGMQEMVFGPFEESAAQEMLGPVVHRRVAAALGPVLSSLV